MQSRSNSASRLWVIAELHGQKFGFPCAAVREMVKVPTVAAVPGAPDYVRGVINLRGRTMPVVDLRRRRHMSSTSDETEQLCAALEARAADHQHWIDALELSVNEGREFTLATDPHQCAFGKWYDAYKTDNVVLSGLLRRFDAPHKKIHALAAEALRLLASGEADKVRQLIAGARSGVLAELQGLFAEFAQSLRSAQREIAVVLENEGYTFAVSVDSIVAVEPLAENSMEQMKQDLLRINDPVVHRVGRRIKSNDLVMPIEVSQILAYHVQAEVTAAANLQLAV